MKKRRVAVGVIEAERSFRRGKAYAGDPRVGRHLSPPNGRG